MAIKDAPAAPFKALRRVSVILSVIMRAVCAEQSAKSIVLALRSYTNLLTGNPRRSNQMNAVLSIVMLAAGALIVGAFILWRKGVPAKQPALMLLLAVIAIVNVLIWTLPGSGGEAPLDQVQRANTE